MKIIFNTCGINGANYEKYLENLKSINKDNADLVISACMNDANELIKLHKAADCYYTKNIIYKCPVNVSFNYTVETLMDDPEGYVYIDSGVNCLGYNIVERLRDFISKNPDAGMVSFKVDTDMGYQEWDIHHTDQDIVIPVGKAVNLHVQWFSYDLLKEYGKIIPDIFASHCTESTFTFLCSAIGKKWYLLGEPVLKHDIGVDGMSSGFSPHKWVAETGRPTYDHPYVIDSVLKRICTKESYQLGFGYEEMRGVFCHDPSLHDDNIAKNPKLKDWIRKNLFLSTEEFDYNLCGAGSTTFVKPRKK